MRGCCTTFTTRPLDARRARETHTHTHTHTRAHTQCSFAPIKCNQSFPDARSTILRLSNTHHKILTCRVAGSGRKLKSE